MNDIIKNLKESPLYNLSLANKELFHSNFIAWFGEKYPTYFINLINKLLPEKENDWFAGNPDKLIIKREYNHFDISVFNGEKLKLVIENKVKSVPTQKQLNEYQGSIKDKNVALILLTMNEQLHELTSDIGSKDLNWKIVNYKNLSDCLSNVVEEADITVDYHKELLKDYCTYICNLQSVIDDNTKRDVFFCNNYKELKELGIHDVCGKRNMQSVYNGLVNDLEKLNIDIVDDINLLENNNVLVAWSYTNAPLIEVRFKKDNDYVLIQIQDKQYRHAVEFFDKEIGIRIAYNKDEGVYHPSEKGIEYLRRNYPYFFGEEALHNYPFNPTEFGMKEKNGYCKYCNGKKVNGLYSCWVYQWVKIPNGITKNDLISKICDDTKKIREELAK